MIEVVLLYALLASTFTVGKYSFNFTAPIFITAARMSIAGLLLLGYTYLFDRSRFLIKGFLWPLIIMSITSIFLANSLEFWSLNYLLSYKACFLYNLAPFFAILFSYQLLKEKMGKQEWLGLAIGFFGFYLMLAHQGASANKLFILSWPEVVMIVATMAMAYGWTYMRKLMLVGYSPLMANGFTMFFGGLLCFIFSYFLEPWHPVPIYQIRPFIACLVYLIIISNFIGYMWYAILLKKYTSTFLFFAGFLSPLFASLYGWFFLDEQLYWQFFFALGFIILGMYVFYQQEMQNSAKEN